MNYHYYPQMINPRLMGDPWIEIRCEECGYEKRLYAEIPEASNEQ